MTPQTARAISAFWFGEEAVESGRYAPRTEWFQKDSKFDDAIRHRFLNVWKEALDGADGQIGDARSALALIVLLDQFPRNMFRGTAEAFASDARALHWAKASVARGWDLELQPLERCFVYLPFEHSENTSDQDESVRLFSQLAASGFEPEPYFRETLEYARRHRDIIARFGRFPHRNAILGRQSTVEELAFLNTPGSSF